MADSYASRLLGVIAVITLSIEVCLSADDLDGVLVRSDGPVRSESVEEATDGLGIFRVKGRIVVKARKADVVLDAYCEAVLRQCSLEFVVYSLYHCRGEIFGGEPVAASDYHYVAAGESFPYIHAEGLAYGSSIFAAVKYGYSADCSRKCVEETGNIKRTVEADNEKSDFFTVLHKPVHCLACNCSA